MNYGNCLLVGDWGNGKTTAASTAPGPVLFLDVDNKLHRMVNMQDKLAKGELIQWAITEPLSMFGLKRLATMEAKPGKIAVQRPKGYLQLVEMIEKLEKDKCVVNGRKIGTLVLDSYTSANEHIKRLIMAVNGTNAMHQQLWGALLSNFEELNNTIMRLPCHSIFIAHERVDKDELTGKISYRPLIDGQMSHKIGKDFEEVYAMTKKVTGNDVRYYMDTIGDNMRSCRTSRILPKEMEPDFSKIFKGGV